MSSDNYKELNYSELFKNLIIPREQSTKKPSENKTVREDGDEDAMIINDNIITFLYYLFPRELFIKALSLIESNDMFIYVLLPNHIDPSMENNKDKNNTYITKTFDDKADKDNMASRSKTIDNNDADDTVEKTKSNEPTRTSIDSIKLIDMLYDEDNDDDDSLIYELIIKSSNDRIPPITTTLKNWNCSCVEFTEHFRKGMMMKNNIDEEMKLIDRFIKIIDDPTKFSNDIFAKIDKFSLSKQYYFDLIKNKGIICPHLLAYSILLKSSKQVLKYFILNKADVILIPITNMDEWLKLHINIII
ncbi:Shu2p NDAI_0A03590 [Naumovozyma dairenensis CBS 421]|uniref:Suppressor of hydroxyurea sensitivity protein 2 n=1 Tax=Naumovozyma dairenensis (strain ATCC 10597 / BCRC 20456 / CBS 421 / NBRC 0211 / NRRL Y-12639) TaxID=1071378 RepID=G0W3X8_NAUDC|nr:hypothetical protein NDAI_0A03590 [Naumovozyma dairenensis CBS 421]CCD22516.1 hypothetical protein NDAI_0A03590 [Naumovozyma dairenensis CBS 421]